MGNNNISLCGSRFCGVWGHLGVSNLAFTNIPARREAESK